MDQVHNRVKLNENDLDWQDRSSPGGKFAEKYKEISETMLDDRESTQKKPFEVGLSKIPPGATNWPNHKHLAAWEYYIILSGQGLLCDDAGDAELVPGDHVIEPPGVAHKIVNTGTHELVYYVIADNPPLDVYYYPDSDKWGISRGPVFRMIEVGYYDGEDEGD